MNKKPRMAPINTRVPPPVRDDLETFAKKDRRTLSSLLRIIVMEWWERMFGSKSEPSE